MHRIVNNWNWFRLLRVGIGIFIIVHGIGGKDTFMIVLGSLFTLLPILNLGCTGGTCTMDNSCSRKNNFKLAKKMEHEKLD
jgi:hypothetical protein